MPPFRVALEIEPVCKQQRSIVKLKGATDHFFMIWSRSCGLEHILDHRKALEPKNFPATSWAGLEHFFENITRVREWRLLMPRGDSRGPYLKAPSI